MKNVDLIRKFGNGATSGKCGNLKINGNNLINYSTIIAKRVENGIMLNNRKYSRTTSVIQNTIRNECNVVGEYVGEVAYIW
ncbi:MAG: hypothetical protein J6J36_03150 [Clostridia bacterium]|nr:hypothetical protein [Clostridia bacterium]